MKNLKIHPFSVVREPVINIDKLLDIPSTDKELEEFILNLFDDKIFAEAIFLSSPELYYEWEKMKSGKINKNVVDSLLKYYLRAMSNTVPFGLMATYSLQSEQNDFVKNEGFSRFSGLDLEYIYKVLNFCKAFPEVVMSQTYYVNNTIYNIGESYRFIDKKIIDDNISYTLASIEKNELLSYLLDLKIKNFSFREILEILVNITDGYSEEELAEYLNSLIAESFFISNFDIHLNSSVPPIDQLLNLIKDYQSLEPLYLALGKVKNILEQIDQNVFNEIDIYNELYVLLDQIGIDYNKKYVINSNLRKDFGEDSFSVPKAKIKKAIETMFILTPKTRRNTALEDLKNRFTDRYGDAEVPLFEALDNDLGVGYKFFDGLERYSSLTDDVAIQPNYDSTESTQTEPRIMSFWARQLLTKKFGEEINLKEEDIAAFEKGDSSFDGSFNISVSNIGGKFIAKSIGGASALNLITRFSNLDNECSKIIDAITKEEEEYFGDKVLYEISHIPYYRGGNLLLRNVDRKYNINLLTPYQDDKEYLSLNDLYISVKFGRIVIRSKELNKEIIPYVTSAQNFHNNSMPIYQFLCDMQTLYRPNTSYINFGGINLSNYIYVPRISYEDVIISPASWNIKKAYFKDNFSIEDFKEFIKKYQIPRFVHLYEFGEEKMIFDLENDTILKIIMNELRKKHIICLNESFFSAETNNSYKEYIYFLSYKNKENLLPQKQTENTTEPDLKENIQRSFTLGSEWIYFKLYCGIGNANKILSEIHDQLISNLLNEGIIDKWFFIRYKDPDFHLRIRFHVTDLSNIGQIIARINEACRQFISDKFIWKIDYSTYERELERYNWGFIEKAENIFFLDSEAAIKAIQNDDPEYADWYKIFLSIQGYYDALEFDMEERLQIMTSIYNGFFMEFGSPKTLNKEINKKFENNYKKLYHFVEEKGYEKAFPIFDVRNSIIKKTVEHLDKNEKYHLIDSLIHMTVNRLVESNPRLHELIVYGILVKYFKKQVGLKNSVLQ